MIVQNLLRIGHLAGAAVLLACTGCTASSTITPGMANSLPDASLGQTDAFSSNIENYLLRPADKLSVLVFREEQLSIPDISISTEGRISIPLVGPIQAAGMSIGELEVEIERLYNARYLREADVAVNVVEYASHIVTVEGAVKKPGMFTFRPGTRLTGGLSLAEGPVREADIRQVAVFRDTAEGTLIAKFDYAQVRAGLMLDPVLLPGDRIVVGTDNLSQGWQDLLRALPAFAIFTQI